MRDGFYTCDECGDRLIENEQVVCTTCAVGLEERRQELIDDAKDEKGEVEYD